LRWRIPFRELSPYYKKEFWFFCQTYLRLSEAEARRFSMNKRGMSLPEVMVAVGIMSIVMMGVTSMLRTVQNEVKSLSEIVAKLEVEKFLISALADDQVCTSELTNPSLNSKAPYTFDAQDPTTLGKQVLSLDRIHMTTAPGAPVLIENSTEASPMSKSLIVKSISVENFSNTGIADLFRAEIVVRFDSTKLVRATAPVRISRFIMTDSTSPASAKKVLGCGSAKPPTINFAKAHWTGKICDPGPCHCPAGEVLLGTTGWWQTYTNPDFYCAPVE
jgi:prepilin-type N-terminal cleavage/methylation domain-containing protein